MGNDVPNSPSELLAMQKGGIREEINTEGLGALNELIRNEIFPEINPDISQVLVLTKHLLQDLEEFHYNVLEETDLTPGQRRIWERDVKNVTKALMALRQVAES